MLGLKIVVITMITAVLAAPGRKNVSPEKEVNHKNEPVIVTKPASLADCNSSLIWIRVKPGEGAPCGTLTGITPQSLELHAKDPLTYNPLNDMSAFEFTQPDAETNLGCPETEAFICALGYPADAGSFTPSEDGASWEPTVDPVCSICRPTE